MKMGIKDIKSKRQEGFTIIEVMIVLVIAAVILLMVFLAVPALQRSSRNTQRKNDAANLMAAVNEYATNHNGQLPASSSEFKSEVLPNVKLGFYDGSSTTTEVQFSNTPGSGGEVDDNDATLYIVTNAKCSSSSEATGTGATSRQFIAGYNVETGGGLDQSQCQDG
jgi:prepilin-type N-terminal cleavage/methylation domain-containing protein